MRRIFFNLLVNENRISARVLNLKLHNLLFLKLIWYFQDRVKRWMSYTWSTQKSFNERKMMEFLPLKMRTDIAMRVHFSTLGKVKLFRNCEPGFYRIHFMLCYFIHTFCLNWTLLNRPSQRLSRPASTCYLLTRRLCLPQGRYWQGNVYLGIRYKKSKW